MTLCRYVNNFDQWRPWDCGIETDTGTHGVWACFSEHLLTLQSYHMHPARFLALHCQRVCLPIPISAPHRKIAMPVHMIRSAGSALNAS